MIKLDLLDVSIHSKEWKQFRKSASQEELFILAIGSKYRLRSTLITSLLFSIGIVASIVIGILLFASGISEGLIVLIVGYLLFSFLSSKHIRYQDTFNQLKGKLKGKYKEQINNILTYSIGLSILDFFLQFALMWLTIPYQAIMLLLGEFAPNFVIAKNGVLVSVPRGYGMDNLILMGEYYKQNSLLDDLMKTQHEKSHKYEGEIINDMGCKTTVYSADGINYRDDSGNNYITNDNGSTFIKQ